MPTADNLESVGPLFQRADSPPEYIERVTFPNAGLAALEECQGAFGGSNSRVDQPARRVGRVRSLPGRTIPTERPAARAQKRQKVLATEGCDQLELSSHLGSCPECNQGAPTYLRVNTPSTVVGCNQRWFIAIGT